MKRILFLPILLCLVIAPSWANQPLCFELVLKFSKKFATLKDQSQLTKAITTAKEIFDKDYMAIEYVDSGLGGGDIYKIQLKSGHSKVLKIYYEQSTLVRDYYLLKELREKIQSSSVVVLEPTLYESKQAMVLDYIEGVTVLSLTNNPDFSTAQKIAVLNAYNEFNFQIFEYYEKELADFPNGHISQFRDLKTINGRAHLLETTSGILPREYLTKKLNIDLATSEGIQIWTHDENFLVDSNGILYLIDPF